MQTGTQAFPNTKIEVRGVLMCKDPIATIRESLKLRRFEGKCALILPGYEMAALG